LPSTPLPETPRAVSGVLTSRQARIRAARRAMAAAGYQEAITWSFTARATAALFGGGQAELMLENPIAAELDCMRPSILPGLIEAAGRNARRGFPDCALYEIGPVFFGDTGADQCMAVTAVLAPHAPKRWDGGAGDDLFTLKADLMALLDELGAPALQVAQDDAPPWWRPGRYARLTLGKATIAAFGEIHPRVLAALDVEGPILAFEVWVEAVPEGRKKTVKTKPAIALSPFMPLTRDFAFVLPRTTPAGDLARAVASADRTLIAGARVFDVYEGAGVGDGEKSVAVEVTIQPRERTLADADIEALSGKIIAAAAKAVGARLRS
jgi:phenylalanyl-tRNA synthetase beta chain